jgi:hypothetical protein
MANGNCRLPTAKTAMEFYGNYLEKQQISHFSKQFLQNL